MGVATVALGLLGYFLFGAVALLLFDVATHRIRSKLCQAASETQHRLAASGNYVGSRTAACLFVVAMWLFWPAVFIGAATDKREDSGES